MRKILFIVLSSLPFFSFAQSTAKEFIEQGVELHDAGKFGKAIESYEKALVLEKDNNEAIYEIALSYTSMKDHNAAIEYAEKLIKSKTSYVGKGYHLKGMNLDYLGQPKEAIAAFKKGIKEAPDYSTLYYSLAITSYQQKDIDTANDALQRGILRNPKHLNSHYLLAVINDDERPKALLALYHFLLLQPEGKKANLVYNEILAKHKIGVSVDVKDEKSINITLAPINEKDPFSTAEVMLSMTEATKSLEENKGKSDFQLFSDSTKSFFLVLGELKANEKHKGFWWDYYVPIFYEIAKDSDLYEAYINYISKDMDYTEVEQWIGTNPEKIEKLLAYVNNYKISR